MKLQASVTREAIYYLSSIKHIILRLLDILWLHFPSATLQLKGKFNSSQSLCQIGKSQISEYFIWSKVAGYGNLAGSSTKNELFTIKFVYESSG